MDQKDAEFCPSERSKIDREVIQAALDGMSLAQLSDLKSTALRFRHLPFPRLVEALFLQQSRRDEAGRSASECLDTCEHDFSDGRIRGTDSVLVRDLLEEIEETLKRKRATTSA